MLRHSGPFRHLPFARAVPTESFGQLLLAPEVSIPEIGLVRLLPVWQELAHWFPTTPIPSFERVIPEWLGLWFALFTTVETLTAQTIAALLVLGSYFIVNAQLRRRKTVAP